MYYCKCSHKHYNVWDWWEVSSPWIQNRGSGLLQGKYRKKFINATLLKGLWLQLHVTFHLKREMPDFLRYPLNRYPLQDLENFIVFLAKMLNSIVSNIGLKDLLIPCQKLKSLMRGFAVLRSTVGCTTWKLKINAPNVKPHLTILTTFLIAMQTLPASPPPAYGPTL